MADFINLPLRDESGAFHVVVEAPRGSRAKLKYEPRLGAFAFGRSLSLGASYPYDWGFFPSTVAEDGDPLDAMVLIEASTWPGTVVPSVPIGVIRLVQREKSKASRERNDRVLVVPQGDERLEHVRDLPARVKSELEEFFVTTSKMAGKDVTIAGWDGPKAAERAILAAAQKYARRGSK